MSGSGETTPRAGALVRIFEISNKKGLHARASAKFVQTVERFDAVVKVTRGNETVGGNSIMGLMMLSAGPGTSITVEDCSVSTWARLWGKRIQLFSPGMLVAALAAECAATGGRMYRAGTRSTALSQHCLCGARVPKTLAQRTHECPRCGLAGLRQRTQRATSTQADLVIGQWPGQQRRLHRQHKIK